MKVPLFKAGLSLLSLFATALAVRTDRNLVETFRWNVFTEQPTATHAIKVHRIAGIDNHAACLPFTKGGGIQLSAPGTVPPLIRQTVHPGVTLELTGRVVSG